MSDQILPDDRRPSKPRWIRAKATTLPADSVPILGCPGFARDPRGIVYSCWRARGPLDSREIYQSDGWYQLPADLPPPRRRSHMEAATPPPDSRPVPGHPGYRIDPRCVVYSCWRGRRIPDEGGRRRRETYQSDSWYLLRRAPSTDGYVKFLMRDESGRLRRVSAHRIMLLSLAGPPPIPDADTRHLNGIRNDNRLENPAWGRRAENVADAAAHGTIYKKLAADDVRAIREMRKVGAKLQSIADRFGVSAAQISNICNGKQWKHVT